MILARNNPMTYRFASFGEASDAGAWREHNEDALRVVPHLGLLIVADGMGGHAAGEVASRITVDTVGATVSAEGLSLRDALTRADENVREAARDGRGAKGMGTTCVACMLGQQGLELAWIGDSRAYRYRSGDLDQVTVDHSYVQSLVDAGLLDPERVESHPDRHILARCIGGGQLSRGEVEVHRLKTAPGDRYVLCTDGLTGELSEAWIAGILSVYPDDQEAADELVRSAVAAGGRDNVTVIVATVG